MALSKALLPIFLLCLVILQQAVLHPVPSQDDGDDGDKIGIKLKDDNKNSNENHLDVNGGGNDKSDDDEENCVWVPESKDEDDSNSNISKDSDDEDDDSDDDDDDKKNCLETTKQPAAATTTTKATPTEKKCDSLTIVYGTATCPVDVVAGQNCTIICAGGYPNLCGASTISCSADDGHWPTPLPFCSQSTCPE